MQSHKEFTNLSGHLRTKYMLTRRSDSLHPIASQLSVLRLSIVLHCFLLKRPMAIKNFDLLFSRADPEDFSGRIGCKLG